MSLNPCQASSWTLLGATLGLVVRNTLLVQPPPPAPAAARPPMPPPPSDELASTTSEAAFADGDPVDADDSLAFLWPEHLRRSAPQPELALRFLPPAAGLPPRAVLIATHFLATRDGTRAVQVDGAEPLLFDDPAEPRRTDQLTLELQGLAPGEHVMRAWIQPHSPRSSERRAERSMRFEVPEEAPAALTRQATPEQTPAPAAPVAEAEGAVELTVETVRGAPGDEAQSDSAALEEIVLPRLTRMPWRTPPSPSPSPLAQEDERAPEPPPSPPPSPPPPQPRTWPSFVVDPAYRRSASELPLLHHPSLPRPGGRAATPAALAAWRTARRALLVGMHAALAPLPRTWRRARGVPRAARYLLTMRVTNRSVAERSKAAAAAASAAGVALSDVAGGGREWAPMQTESVVNYAILDAAFRPLGGARLLPLRAQPTRQVKSGPEDGRLASVAGRLFLVYNDAIAETGGDDEVAKDDEECAAAGEATAAEEAAYRIRRGIHLAELRLGDSGDEECDEGDDDDLDGDAGGGSGGGGDGDGSGSSRMVGVRVLTPVALTPDARVVRAVGSRSDVEKNWVVWGEEGGRLLISYSLEPHRVLSAALPGTVQEEEDDGDGGGGEEDEEQQQPAASVMEARLVHSSRFVAADEEGRRRWPLMRGGTNAVAVSDSTLLAVMHVVHKRGGRSLYQMAAYSFAAAPPHAVLAMGAPFSVGDDAPTPFPTGLVADKKHLYLSYGVGDAEWRLAKLDLALLLASLVPVHTEPADDATTAASSVPNHMHFFSGIDETVRGRLEARVRRRMDGAASQTPKRGRAKKRRSR